MKISVIIPVYNASDTIITTLESVRNQTYKNLEIILINDGSTDASLQRVQDYINEFPDLDAILINQVNGGVSKARNIGLKLATGDYIALLDSDDEWLPNKIERQVQVLNENEYIDFLGTNRNGEHFKSFLFIKFDKITKITAKNLLYKMFFITPTVIFKKEILEEIGYFNENKRYAEDALYFIQIAEKKVCYLLNESLTITSGGKAYFGEMGLSSNLWEMQKGELSNLKYAFKNSIINIFEYCFIFYFLMFKFFRRVLLVKRDAIINKIIKE